MKITILSDDFPPYHKGGAGVIAETLAKGLQKRGHELSVITTTGDPLLAGVKEIEGIHIHTLYSSYHSRWRSYISLYNPFVVHKLEKILRDLKPDVIHVHNIHMHLSYYSLKLAKKNAPKVFFTAHDAMLFHYGKLTLDFMGHKVSPWQQFKTYKKDYNPFRNIMIKHYLKYVDVIFAVSDALKRALVDNGITNVDVIHNGIDLTEFDVTNEETGGFQKKYNIKDKKVILFAGRLSTQKGGKAIIEILAKVSSDVPNVILLIAGNKDLQAEKMLLYAKELGVEDRLIFTGWLSPKEMKTVYRLSDLVAVLSTYLDPFPTINLEAMASKRPVIGTCFGGTPEAVVNGVTGYVVDPFEIDTCASKVADILLYPEKAKIFGEEGYLRAKKFFTSEIYSEKTENCYKKRL